VYVYNYTIGGGWWILLLYYNIKSIVWRENMVLLGLSQSQYITSRVVIILASATYSTEINQLLCPHKKLVQRTSRFWKGRHRSGLWLGRFDGTGGVGELLQIGTMNFENRLDIYIYIYYR
jgi:hypothetical protein